VSIPAVRLATPRSARLEAARIPPTRLSISGPNLLASSRMPLLTTMRLTENPTLRPMSVAPAMSFTVLVTLLTTFFNFHSPGGST